MSGTRLPSRPAPAIDARSAVVVAHGAPSDPWTQERAIRALAFRVACLLPGWSVEGATLAAKGSFASALEATHGRRPLVYPLFMSDGWFVSTRLPELIAEYRDGAADVAAPLGTDPAVHALCTETLRRAAAGSGYECAETTVLLAAHGSPTDPRPCAVARQAADRIAETGGFRAVKVGFIDGAPSLSEAARIEGPALCLPFFAARAGHVTKDLPAALASASFPGALLPPVGTLAEIPALIAKTLMARAAPLAA